MGKSEKPTAMFEYNEASIRSLDWREHIRLRPGMYIGKLGDGSSKDDGIYVLVKEVIDNCIDEHMMGYGRTIDVTITESRVTVRDYGRGIPLGKVVDVVSKINTVAKFTVVKVSFFSAFIRQFFNSGNFFSLTFRLLNPLLQCFGRFFMLVKENF